MIFDDGLVEEVFRGQVDAVGFGFQALPLRAVGGRGALDLPFEIGIALGDAPDDVFYLALDVIVVLPGQAANFEDGSGEVGDVGCAPVAVVSSDAAVDATDDESWEAGELVAAGGIEFEALKGGDDAGEFLGGVDVTHVVHCADPCGFTDGVDEELDGAGVQGQEFHAGRLRNDADIAEEAALYEVDGPYPTLQFADNGGHEEVASHWDAGPVERDKGGRGSGDSGLHVDEAMGVDDAVFYLEFPRIAFEVHGDGINVHVAVEHDGLAAAGALHLVVEVRAAGFIGDVDEVGIDAAFCEPCLEFSHGARLMRREALVLVEPSHEVDDFVFIDVGVNQRSDVRCHCSAPVVVPRVRGIVPHGGRERGRA